MPPFRCGMCRRLNLPYRNLNRVIPNAACGGGILWCERWTRYSALIQGIPRRFAPRDDARLCAEGLIYGAFHSERCRICYFYIYELADCSPLFHRGGKVIYLNIHKLRGFAEINILT